VSGRALGPRLREDDRKFLGGNPETLLSVIASAVKQTAMNGEIAASALRASSQ
jgi:hypothetical protein